MSDTLTICPHCDKMNKISLEQLKNGKAATCGNCQRDLPLHGAVSEVNEEQMWRIIRKADKPVLVDFWASWCGPCKMYGPVFQQASLQTDKAIFLKVNTEANQKVSAQMGIRGIPATLVFNNGAEINRQSGALPLQGVLQLIP